jgi:hypothetical protein
MVLRGSLCLPECALGPEQGAWLPGGWRGHIQLDEDAVELVLLLALAHA